MLYAALAEEFRGSHRLDSALHYDQLAVLMAEQSKFLDRRALAACSMARTLLELGRSSEALKTINALYNGVDGANLSLRSRIKYSVD